jgi:hypothetical protein
VKGLPEDISFDEMKDFFQKAGILKIDSDTNQEKIKIYTDEQDICKVLKPNTPINPPKQTNKHKTPKPQTP